MTLTGTFFDLAMLAQAWRVTYVVSGIGSFTISAMIFKALFTRRKAALYCLRSSQFERVINPGGRGFWAICDKSQYLLYLEYYRQHEKQSVVGR